jgi:hypothetical protein
MLQFFPRKDWTMANISVNLSQTLYNALNPNGTSAADKTANLSDYLGLFFVIDQNFGATHTSTTSSTITANSARLNYADGGYTDFSGVVFADPNAASGTATASHVQSEYPNNYRLTYDGTMNYHYTLVGSNATLAYDGGTLGKVTLRTELPTTDAGYSQVYGNETLTASGKVIVGLGSFFSGTVNELTSQADRLVASSKVTGDFNISGNAIAIGTGLGHASVSGTLSGYDVQYYDGSHATIAGAGMAVSGSTVIDEQLLLANADNLPGDDIINVTLPSTLVTPWTLASGAGNDTVTITGGGAGLSVNAGSGNDSIGFGDDGHSVDGGSGTDTAIFAGAKSAYTIGTSGANITVHANAAGSATDTLANVERLQFADTTLALDISGTAGQAYRLYQAAFNRAPDAEGLGFWIHYMDNGMSLNEVAQRFMPSPEFQALYGSNPSNADFVDKLYHNVLHRAGEDSGVKFWMDYLTTGGGTQAKVLAFFGESPENQAALIGVIGNGITFTHYG